MGYNTTVIVLNDALHEIERDPQFGKKLSDAILKHACSRAADVRRGVDVSAGNHINAATVIESHHADGNAIVAIGGNCGSIVGHTFGTHHKPEDREKILRELANQLGYTLRKKKQRIPV